MSYWGALKREPDEAAKRLVTLAMEREPGELAEALYARHGLAHTQVVLGSDGCFLKANELHLPRAADLNMFQGLVAGINNLKEYGFCLPNAVLLKRRREVLDGLAKDTEAPDAKYLRKGIRPPTLLEHAASDASGGRPAVLGPVPRICSGAVQHAAL